MRGPCLAVIMAAIVSLTLPAAGQGNQRPESAIPHKDTPQKAAPQEAPKADSVDLQTLDRILAALYDVISGPAGQQRNWDRFRSLFLPGARLIAATHGPKGKIVAKAFTVDEYVSRAQPVFDREGFYEREIGRRSENYNHLTQVFSAYESRHAPDEKPFERGLNAIQLLNDGRRWWVVNVFWEAETPNHPIPKDYLQH